MAGAAETLVDAVVTFLGTKTLTGTPTIAKDLYVLRQLEDVTALTVIVSAGAEEWEKLTRAGDCAKTYSVLVFVIAPCDDDDAVIGPFVELTEDLKTELISGGSLSGLAPVSVDQTEPFSSEHLYESGQFFANIIINYRGVS